jgi:hypothetical protein
MRANEAAKKCDVHNLNGYAGYYLEAI